jgi:hypothetical protein
MRTSHAAPFLFAAFVAILNPVHADESFAAWTWEKECSWESLKWFSQPIVEDLGPNGDGLADLIFYHGNGRELHVWRQTAAGLADEPEIFTFPDNVSIWDLGDVNGRPGSEIVFLNDRGEAMALALGNGDSKPLSLFSAETSGAINSEVWGRTKFLLDLDGNGLDDIVMPAESGFQWHMQVRLGEFEGGPLFPLQMEAHNTSNTTTGMDRSFLSRMNRDCIAGEIHDYRAGNGFRGERWLDLVPGKAPFSFSYKSFRAMSGEAYRLADLNGDGRLDVRLPKRVLQGADGSFDFDAPGLPRVERVDVSVESEPELNIDINGDGYLDFFTINKVSHSMQNPKTEITVRIIDADGASELFSKTQTLSLYPWSDPLADLNGDGALDFFGAKVDFQLASAQSQMKAFFGKGIDAELRVHLWRQGKGYSAKPDVRCKMRVVGDPQNYMMVPDMDYTHDFTGDGYPDILVRTKPRQLSLIPYEPKKEEYAKKPAGVLDLPGSLDVIEDFPDLNGDGKCDLILRLSADDNYSDVRYFVALTK